MSYSIRAFALAFAVSALPASALPMAAGADEPAMHFDWSGVAAVNTIEGRPDGSAIVELRLPISARRVAGKSESIDSLTVEITNPRRRLGIVSYEPATTLASEFAEPITVASTKEHTLGGGVSLGAAIPLPIGELTIKGSPGADLSSGSKNVRTETVKKVPPQEAVITSGTTDSGHGVYFTFRRWSGGPLEGTHEVVCRLSVPAGWRAEWLVVTVHATGRADSLFGEKTIEVGRARRLIVAYHQGDVEARAAAESLAAAQSQWISSRQDRVGLLSVGWVPWRSGPVTPDWAQLFDSAEDDKSLEELLSRSPRSPAETALVELVRAHASVESLARR